MAATMATRTSKLQEQPAARTKSPNTKIKAENSSTTSSKKGDAAAADVKPSVNADTTAPLAPPPKPTQSGNDGGDYFSNNHQGNNPSYNGETNLFDSAFSKLPETPGGTQLPPVASLTSPAGQLTGTSTGGYNWGNGSLRSGPLSPAMLSGPAGEDYFSTSGTLRGGFPTPNESSLRTGLTPGGGGSMFPPAPSPNTTALFNSMTGFNTPGGLDFHRTAMSANKKADPFTSSGQSLQASTATNDPNVSAPTNQQNFDQHDAANGLFMLAQAGTESQGNAFGQSQQGSKQHANRANNGSISNISDGTQGRESEESEQKPNTRNKGKKGANAKNARKAEETPSKQPAKKKGKANNGSATSAVAQNHFDMDDGGSDMDNMDDDDDDGNGEHKDTRKMTDEEKRKNFLERNRVAALKCRQRKKQWLANLQNKVEVYSSENDALNVQNAALREEVLNLKTILIAHKDCPIAHQQAHAGNYVNTNGVDYGGQPNPYGQFQPQLQQPVHMSGPDTRRFS